MTTKHDSVIGKLMFLLRKIHLSPWYLMIPVLLGVVAAALEGAGMGLLIPILSGFLQKDFSFIKDLPILGDVINLLPTGISGNDRYLFVTMLTIFVAVILSKNIFKYFSSIGVAYYAERSLHHLRKVIFTRYLSFGKLYFDTTSVGHHNTLLLEFVRQSIRPFILMNKYMNAAFSLVVYLVIMFFISWKLTLFALPLFLLLHVAVRYMIVKMRALSHSIAERGSELGKKAVEILSTIPLVKAYHTEEQERNYYTEISNEKAKLDFHVRALHNLILPLQEILTLVAAVAIFSGALYWFGRDQLASAPSFLVYFYIVINASSKFGTLSSFRGALAQATGPIDEVLEVFNEEGKYYVRGGKEEFPGLKEQIEFRNLTFSYGDRDVLTDVVVAIKEGSMTAVVGPTGGGKTTLINLLMRYYDCPSSSIFLDGTDIREFTLESLLKHIALVSQETLLLHASLRDNITYGLTDVSEEELQEVLKRSRLADFVQSLPKGLDTLIGDRGVKLSGGEKQRVSIARALLKKAEILILDEATSSLDSRTEKLIQEAIDEAVTGRTAIVIAHRLSTIRNADHIVVMDEGKCVEQGTPDELLGNKGKFHELWEEQKIQ